MNKYFFKQQLARCRSSVRVLGIRYAVYEALPRSYLLATPIDAGKDVETTRRSCEKFRRYPTTIVNFVEGSRFTHEKRQQNAFYLINICCRQKQPVLVNGD